MNFVKKVFLLTSILASMMQLNAAADPIPQTPCREDGSTQTALFMVPQGQYQVYISTDSGNDVAQVYLNQSNDLNVAHCESTSGNLTLNQHKNLAGQVTITKTALTNWYVRTESSVSESINANRIRIFLVPSTLQICIETRCKVDETHSQQIIPVESNAANNRIIISYYVDPSTDSLQRVDYFADENFLFSEKTIKPFPTEYQSIGKYSKLSTLSRYSSGQIIIHTQQLNDQGSGYASPFELIMTYINPYMDKLPTIGILFGIALLLYGILLLYRKWYNIRQWRYNHGLLIHKYKPYDSEKAIKRLEFLNSWLKVGRTTQLLLGIFIVFILFSTFIIDKFDVSGHSMDKTLHAGQKVVILKIPVTYEKFIHGTYIPKRGSIIVAKINESEGSYVSTFGNGKKALIKRVVAIPGDRIVVKDSAIYVYQQNKGRPIAFDEDQPWASTVQATADHYSIDRVLGINEVFVAGDNRAASIDSRINGPINAAQIIGVLVYKF